MKFLVPVALLTVITVGSVLPVWLPLPLPARFPAAQPALLVRHVSPAAAPAASQLVGFVSSSVAASAPSLLREVYFYEGQYVRRGQVLAKLRVRATKASAYLTAAHDGVLSRARVAVGEVLTPQVPLATLTDQTRLLVRLHPAAARHLHAGDSVQISLVSTPAAAVRGKITAWQDAASPTPLLTLQLHRSLAGAAIGVSLLVGAAPAAGRVQVAEAAPAPKRQQLVYSPAVAQE
ncbi:HlyD family secretion protein [Hymenobacter algoricola]|uniref:HlyD family efflux transporter periplasmic adaptor subunit n=1 Tax=Hymenobacter algoricola TaxID=486267 RepID=A0ABP7NXH0_9BACT